MTLETLIAQLQDLSNFIGPDTLVYIDTGAPQVSQVEIEQRNDTDGTWVALTAGETVWS